MKKISEILLKEGIILDLKEKEKTAVIKELSEKLIHLGYITDPEEFFSEILKRENLESTGIGMGIAIPHTRSKAVKELVIVFGRSKELNKAKDEEEVLAIIKRYEI